MANSTLNKDFPKCAKEALVVLRANHKSLRISKNEIAQLINEYIFNNEYSAEQNTWKTKSTAKEEFQSVDCILSFLENESDAAVRDYVFELLFDNTTLHEISHHTQILQLLLSYAISLLAERTLDCCSKWILHSIGNELIQPLFDQLVKDHLLLAGGGGEDAPQPYLVTLARKSPLFASLFMTILLDMISTNMLSNPEKSFKRLFRLFEIWIDANPMLPLLAFKSNLSHASSYMLNPVPGFIFVTVIYPLKNALECMKSHSSDEEQRSACLNTTSNLDDLVNKVHLISLKLIKDLGRSKTGSSTNALNLLNKSHLDSVCKRLTDLEQESKTMSATCYFNATVFENTMQECAERLAQMLEICWTCGFIACSKGEISKLFAAFMDRRDEATKRMDHEDGDNIPSLFRIVLGC